MFSSRPRVVHLPATGGVVRWPGTPPTGGASPMLALHRGRTAITLACLLATALGGAATHAPPADASFGQVKSAFGSLGTGPGQFSVLGGIAYRPSTSRLYAADQYTDDNTGDPVFR